MKAQVSNMQNNVIVYTAYEIKALPHLSVTKSSTPFGACTLGKERK